MTDDTVISRRTVLSGVAGVAGATALASVPTAAAKPGFGGYLDNTSNYDGLVDKTGSDKVTIEVGVSGNNGPNGFGPAAVRVDPGTTVVWKWTGNGGHNVVAEDGSFESDLTGESGHTFEQTFDSEGVNKYYCNPHKVMGMKGVVVVGEPGVGGGGGSDSEEATGGPDYGDWFVKTDNFEETVDKTGQAEVTIEVGAGGNKGPYAFDPPAVRVDPGTSIVWEWTGAGGAHNVVAKDGSFQSELTSDSGHTFEQTFESGLHTYSCIPHKEMGMRGAIVVGGADGQSDSGPGRLLAIGSGIGLAGAIFGLFGAGLRENSSRRE